MKIAALLRKIPWKNLFRLVPGVIGLAGELALNPNDRGCERREPPG